MAELSNFSFGNLKPHMVKSNISCLFVPKGYVQEEKIDFFLYFKALFWRIWCPVRQQPEGGLPNGKWCLRVGPRQQTDLLVLFRSDRNFRRYSLMNRCRSWGPCLGCISFVPPTLSLLPGSQEHTPLIFLSIIYCCPLFPSFLFCGARD